jgi:anhydro-N-acetylmuramic acid kinase
MGVDMRALGLMSGTSLDGVDAAIIETDGVDAIEHGPWMTLPYTSQERKILEEAVEIALEKGPIASLSPQIFKADRVILETHAKAVNELLGLYGRGVDVVGLHGQTLLHRPTERLSWQLGDGAALCAKIGIDVISGFRQADIAAGGQGAPLVPVYHRALARRAAGGGGIAIVNIGGVSNLTYVGTDGHLSAFDVGPGNGLIDQIVVRAGLGNYDKGGALGARGVVNQARLDEMLSNTFFKKAGPKSLDRYDFTLDAVNDLSTCDAIATLTALTAEALSRSTLLLPEAPVCWIICGGGRHNNTLLRELRSRLPGRCLVAEDVGYRGDAIEAELMAYLAVRCLRNLPITFPETTGVRKMLTGGVVHFVSEASQSS